MCMACYEKEKNIKLNEFTAKKKVEHKRKNEVAVKKYKASKRVLKQKEKE